MVQYSNSVTGILNIKLTVWKYTNVIFSTKMWETFFYCSTSQPLLFLSEFRIIANAFIDVALQILIAFCPFTRTAERGSCCFEQLHNPMNAVIARRSPSSKSKTDLENSFSQSFAFSFDQHSAATVVVINCTLGSTRHNFKAKTLRRK
jgi:hypothetical protein